jgi:hypothetical protein
MMKSIVLFLGFSGLLPPLCAQAAPTAIRRAAIQVGVAGSAYTLDYGEGYEEGITVYGDLDFTRHLGVEALYRNASIHTPRDIGENHLLIGPRYKFEHGRFAPYAKGLIGEGTINFQQGYNLTAYSENYFIYALGGGADLHVTRHVNVRLIDFEYQIWPNFQPHGLTPYGYSVGAAYAF